MGLEAHDKEICGETCEPKPAPLLLGTMLKSISLLDLIKMNGMHNVLFG